MTIRLSENFRALFYAPFYAAHAIGAYEAEGVDAELFIRAAADAPPLHALDDERLFTSRWGPFTQGYDRYVGGHVLSFSPLDFR